MKERNFSQHRIRILSLWVLLVTTTVTPFSPSLPSPKSISFPSQCYRQPHWLFSAKFPAPTSKISTRSKSPRHLVTLSATRTKEDDSIVDASDLEGIQKLFSKYCNSDGLMSKEEMEAMPPFAELLVRIIYQRPND